MAGKRTFGITVINHFIPNYASIDPEGNFKKMLAMHPSLEKFAFLEPRVSCQGYDDLFFPFFEKEGATLEEVLEIAGQLEEALRSVLTAQQYLDIVANWNCVTSVHVWHGSEFEEAEGPRRTYDFNSNANPRLYTVTDLW